MEELAANRVLRLLDLLRLCLKISRKLYYWLNDDSKRKRSLRRVGVSVSCVRVQHSARPGEFDLRMSNRFVYTVKERSTRPIVLVSLQEILGYEIHSHRPETWLVGV